MKTHGRLLAGLVLLLSGGRAEAELIVGFAGPAPGRLIAFDSEDPGTLLRDSPISGVPAGEVLQALDLRPATGELYVMSALCNAVECVHRLGRFDLSTATVHPFTSTFSSGPHGFTNTVVGMDIDPVRDEVRVVTPRGAQVRLNPDTGTVMGAATPLPIELNIRAIAFSNNVNSSSTTTLYGFDFVDAPVSRQLGTIGGINGSPSPDSGTFTAIGPAGGNAEIIAAFDISVSGRAFVDTIPSTFPFDRACPLHTQIDSLQEVDLSTGNMTPLGLIGYCGPVFAIAALGPTPPVAVPALDLWGVFALTAALALTAVIILGERWRRS